MPTYCLVVKEFHRTRARDRLASEMVFRVSKPNLACGGHRAIVDHTSQLRGIYGIVDAGITSDPLALLETMLGAGIVVVQYRAKSGVDRELVRAMVAATRRVGALLVVNDDLEAALEADGWHAGQQDLAACDAREVRARLGRRLFGISCGVPEEARAAELAGADYVGVGPFAATASKLDAGEAIGELGIRAVVAATDLPVVAIGGIGDDNLAAVARSGAAMAAVISSIASAPSPAVAARRLVARWAELV